MSNFYGKLGEIEDIIGVENTLKIISAWGGKELVIPMKAVPNIKLVKLIGMSAATNLIRDFGSGKIWIPMLHFKGIGRRRLKISQMLKEGYSVNEIVDAVDVCDRTVFRIKQKDYERLPLIEWIEEQERKEHEEKKKNCC